MIPEKEPYSDYINASYIDVRHTLDIYVFTTPDSILYYTGLQEKTSILLPLKVSRVLYITSFQAHRFSLSHGFCIYIGPTDNSVEDFWRMIWELRIPTVVMLTRIFEGRVSDRGWAGCGVFTR